MDLKSFKTDWKLLQETDQKMLKIITVAYEPLSRRHVASLFNEAGLRTGVGLKFTQTNVRPYLLKLMTDGFLEEDRTVKCRVTPLYREWVMRMAVIDPRFKETVRDIQRVLPLRSWSMMPRNYETALRDLRIAFYQGDLAGAENILETINQHYPNEWAAGNFYGEVFEPFDAKWIGTFPNSIQMLIIAGLLENALRNADNPEVYLNYAEVHPAILRKNAEDLRKMIFLCRLQKGNWSAAEKDAAAASSNTELFLRRGVLKFLRGDTAEALDDFAKGGKLYRKAGGAHAKYIPEIEGVFHMTALLHHAAPGYLGEVKNYYARGQDTYYQTYFRLLYLVSMHLQNHDVRAFVENIQITSALQGLFVGWAAYWTQTNLSKTNAHALEKYYTAAAERDYRWLAMEYGFLLAALNPASPHKDIWQVTAEKYRNEIGARSLLNMVKRTEGWERTLSALAAVKLKTKRGAAAAADSETRLVWLVDFEREYLQPKEQKLTKSGSWSKGRNVSLKRLREDGVDCMTDQDQRVRKAFKRYSGYYGGPEYSIDFYVAAKALIGHPLLFLNSNPSVSVDLTEKEPELIVEQKGDKFEMRFIPDFYTTGVSIIKETPTRYTLINVSENHAEIKRILGGSTLEIPEAAKERIIKAVGNVSSAVTVHSVVGGGSETLPEIAGDAMIYVHLLPIGDGFKLEFFVKPFRTDPPYFKPGVGGNNAIAEVQGQKTLATRDLDAEKAHAAAVIEACPTLSSIPSYNYEWSLEETEQCLNVLLELEPLRSEDKIVLEYPKGEKIKIVGLAGFGNMRMNMSKNGNWFAVDGEVQLSEDRVMDFATMLSLAELSETRYIEISKGEFVALTEQLRAKLDELNGVLHKSKGGMRIHPLAAGVLDDMEDELAQFKADKAWKHNRARLSEALKIQPKVPSTFKAELRDYQKEGFVWMSQLAHWGVGACLADDMGLGKTVQGLALILSRAKHGPAMVVAPASVARNWLREAEKFTPTLNPILFGQGDRIQAVADLKPFDLLIASYGLMQQESELLSTVTFSTLVLDEAQAIKNRATKRSKAAMEMQADFRLATTGTPIENHLGELWNLFNFLNPGLLGSLKHFNDKFALPIERYEDKEKRQQLRKLLQPFILRRRKTDVLRELPPKTEITLTVELSADERAYYEALRRNAVDKIESTEGFGAKRFQILAELMRLRQACCNLKMIDPAADIGSSKLDLFAETVSELLENGHKVLVFSQFVKHLRLIENWVKENNITYQYLDGQTPLPAREAAVNAFQAGESELFLISLKAGGTGLNLTAADYVIHLDPWWNPAVEDQASDRAHRIGQQRPVTIYRLVTENTIEEKIVRLHGEKRDLADSLLEGTEASAKMGADDLLNLIKEG